jgi:hypothetical protein
MNALLGTLAFGCLVYLATLGCDRLARQRIGSGALLTQVLRLALCAAAAVAGGILLGQAAPPATIFSLAILCAALGATCFLATRGYRVPVAIPGAALVILIGAALLQGDAGPLDSACVTGAPFALTALFARGTGADWRDAVVGALGGAAFGLQLGLFVAGFACLALALTRTYLNPNSTQPRPTIAFSSALAGTFMLVLVGRLAVA